jgi:hypothetical protein
MNIINPVTFIDKLIKRNELAQPFRLTDHQRKILRLAFAFDDDGRLPWNTILYSCIKKSGKTTLNGRANAGLGIHARAAERNLILANDLERLSPGETILGADSVLEARIAAAEKKLAADTAAKRR